MPKDLSVPAARKALQYKSGTHPGGGLPAADVSADQAHDWYTAGQVQEALDSGSHAYAASDDDTAKSAKRKAAEPEAPDAAPKESE